jgi:hypothetical protein
MSGVFYEANPDVLFADLGDDKGVLLDLTSKFYFHLNPTAVRLWRLVACGPTTVASAAETLQLEFDVGREQATADVATWFAELEAEALIHARSTRAADGKPDSP